MNSKKLISLFIVMFLLLAMLVSSVFADLPIPGNENKPVATSFHMIPIQEIGSSPLQQWKDLLKRSMYQQDHFSSRLEQSDLKMEDLSHQRASGAAGYPSVHLGINSLPANQITIDLTQDVVMGWVDPGELVEIAYGTEGYGTAVADGIGFFWTPIWHNTDRHQIGIDCGISFSINVNGSETASLTPHCFEDTYVLVNENKISGNLAGAGEGLSVTAQLVEFDFYTHSLHTAQGAPAGSGLTDSSGLFEISNIDVDLGVESVVALDFEQTDINIRNYVLPQEVFMVHQMNSILGFANPGEDVVATVYEGAGPDVRWSSDTQANWPLGFYSFSDVSVESGDRVIVELSGGPTLTTMVAQLGNFIFNTETDSLQGNAADGASIRTALWQWQGQYNNYFEEHTTADSIGFSINFSSNLKAYDEVLVIATDSSGNQTQILSGAPYIYIVQDPYSNLDCIEGRLEIPSASIVVTLDKGGDGTVDYVRETGWVSNAGNGTDACFLVRSPNYEWGPINFDPGDIVALSDGSDWGISADVIAFDWSWNTLTETISGQGFPDGEMEVIPMQWLYGWYPVYGTVNRMVDIVSGEFSASITDFDVRDGQSIQLIHYDTEGNTNTYYYREQPALPYFEIQLNANAVAGWVGVADDLVTVSLYANESASVPLVTTSQDNDEDPYIYWIDNFEAYELEPGMKVVVISESGWSAQMIIPELKISGNYVTNEVSGSGPEGLLFFDTWGDNQNLGMFIPTDGASEVFLQTDNYGYDLLQGDTVSLTYQAPDGNRARQEERLGDLYRVGHWLNFGSQDWMWGEAIPGSNITISIDGGDPIQTYFEDPNCPACWGIHEPQDINPGDEITVSSDTGYSLTYSIPNPLISEADSESDTVTGQIGGRADDWVYVQTWWDGQEYEVTTAEDGTFILQSDSEISIDVPLAGEGRIYFNELHGEVLVDVNQYFRTYDLSLHTNYDHDWIEGNYPPGYDIVLTVTESDQITEKATITLTTGEIPWWGGSTGFSTDINGAHWVPEHPDIQPGDWVFGEVTVGENIYSAEVQLGIISGVFSDDTNSFSGTLNAPWLPQDIPVLVQCHPWGAPEGTNDRESMVLPTGADEFTCDWSGEWDVQPNQEIAVLYQDPATHLVFTVHRANADELILSFHYDHGWIHGYYEADHEIFLQVLDDKLNEKAHINLVSGYIDGWGSTTGFDTWMEGAEWIPSYPDIQPGDTIHGEVDDGSQFTADVKIGLVTANWYLGKDQVSGTVNAPWLPQGEQIKVGCYIWEDNAPADKEDWVFPNGVDTYTCDWSDDDYNLTEMSGLMVAYFEPVGHELIGEFRYSGKIFLPIITR